MALSNRTNVSFLNCTSHFWTILLWNCQNNGMHFFLIFEILIVFVQCFNDLGFKLWSHLSITNLPNSFVHLMKDNSGVSGPVLFWIWHDILILEIQPFTARINPQVHSCKLCQQNPRVQEFACLDHLLPTSPTLWVWTGKFWNFAHFGRISSFKMSRNVNYTVYSTQNQGMGYPSYQPQPRTMHTSMAKLTQDLQRMHLLIAKVPVSRSMTWYESSGRSLYILYVSISSVFQGAIF